VIERRIHDVDARGAASHGWVEEQRESFAAMCRSHGFDDVATGAREGSPAVLWCVARVQGQPASSRARV
jgi:hypothetical protein